MGILIFDIMTHTPEEFVLLNYSFHASLLVYRDSGVGDHGVKGIERWRDQHDCNAFCKRLELGAGDSDDEDIEE